MSRISSSVGVFFYFSAATPLLGRTPGRQKRKIRVKSCCCPLDEMNRRRATISDHSSSSKCWNAPFRRAGRRRRRRRREFSFFYISFYRFHPITVIMRTPCCFICCFFMQKVKNREAPAAGRHVDHVVCLCLAGYFNGLLVATAAFQAGLGAYLLGAYNVIAGLSLSLSLYLHGRLNNGWDARRGDRRNKEGEEGWTRRRKQKPSLLRQIESRALAGTETSRDGPAGSVESPPPDPRHRVTAL